MRNKVCGVSPPWFRGLSAIVSLVAQTVKNLSAMQKTWVRSPRWGDPLEKGMATHSSILAWRIPCRGAWWATVPSTGWQESDTTAGLMLLLYLRQQLANNFKKIIAKDDW